MRSITAALRAQCVGLDPDAVALVEVVPLFGELERIAKLVAGGQAAAGPQAGTSPCDPSAA